MLVEELIDGCKVFLIRVQIVQQICVPAFRCNDQLTFAAALDQLVVQIFRIASHDLIATDKQKRGRQILELTQQGRNQRIHSVGGIVVGIEIQRLQGHRGINRLIFLIRYTGCSQVGPRRDANDAAGHIQTNLPKLQAQTVAQSTACAFTAKNDLLSAVALLQKVLIGFQGVIQSSGEGMLRCQPVSRAEDAHTGLNRQYRAKTLGIFQATAGISTAVEI